MSSRFKRKMLNTCALKAEPYVGRCLWKISANSTTKKDKERKEKQNNFII
jgi:hypothetical protein